MTKAIVFLGLVGLAACNLVDSRSSDETRVDQAALTALVQIDCGSASAASPFVADTDFSPVPGTTINHANPINVAGVTNPAPVAVYQTARIGNFTYTIPGFMAGSSNVVRLHFAETFFTSAGGRVFNVDINGQRVLANFDIFKTAGATNKAVVQQFTAAANGSGAYVIQCTSVVNNSLLSGVEVDRNDTCTAGAACTPANVCHTGTTSCSTGTPVCVDNGSAANGSSCGINQVCNGGACVACTSGAACHPGGNVCEAGQTSCATGTAVCVDMGPAPNGTACGANAACNGGACVVCSAGASCTPVNICDNGQSSCASGTSVCVDTGPNPAKNGTSCGANQVCNGGACVACTAGQACQPANPCGTGSMSCSTGTPVCVEHGPAPNGSACGGGQVCNNGVCGTCSAGVACTPANVCATGVVSCATGAPVCVDSGADVGKNGVSCGTNLVCNGGVRTSCVAGLTCVPSNACDSGQTSCSTGTSVCVDTGANGCRNGSSCGAGRVCNNGVCN